jgi:uncharacterized membrane protein
MSKGSSKKRQIAKSKAIPITPQQTHQQLVMAQRQEFYQGIIPHPDHLARFEEVLPGLANRIMLLTEGEQDAAHAAAKADQAFREHVLAATVSENKRKHATALIALVLCLSTTVALAYLGATHAAEIVGGTTVVGVIGSFLGSKLRDVIGKRQEKKT